MGDAILMIHHDRNARGRLIIEKQWDPDFERYEYKKDHGAFPPVPDMGVRYEVDRRKISTIPIIPLEGKYVYNQDYNKKILILSCAFRYKFSNDERNPYTLVPCLIELPDGNDILGFRHRGRTYFFRPPYETTPLDDYGDLNPRGRLRIKEMNDGHKALRLSPLVGEVCMIKLDDQNIAFVEDVSFHEGDPIDDALDEAPSTYPQYCLINF